MNYQNIRRSIAIKIKSMREGQNLSQNDLSSMTGISQKTISNLEDPDFYACQLDKLQAIAGVFNLEVWDLVKPDEFTKDSDKKTVKLASSSDFLDKETMKLAKSFQKLSPKNKTIIKQTIKSLIESNKAD